MSLGPTEPREDGLRGGAALAGARAFGRGVVVLAAAHALEDLDRTEGLRVEPSR